MLVLWGILFNFLVFVQCSANCPSGQPVSIIRGSNHYWFPANKTSFHDANTLCQERGMVLANISTFEKLNEVLDVVPGSSALWVGIFTPFSSWLNCEDAACHRQLYSIVGTPLSYYEMNVPLNADQSSMCLQLNRSGHILSQNCETPLQAVCEVDCSPPGHFASALNSVARFRNCRMCLVWFREMSRMTYEAINICYNQLRSSPQ